VVSVHTHLRSSTFVHPRELTLVELASRADDFTLFVQAVALGVLIRAERGEEDGLYKIVVKGQTRYVGDEKHLRQEGFSNFYRDAVQTQVNYDLAQLQAPDQLAMWVALLEYYLGSVYPLIVKIVKRQSEEIRCLPTLRCEALVNEWTFRLINLVDESQAERLLRSAREGRNKWTYEVAGSISDVYQYEVNTKDIKLKRVLKREVLHPEWKMSQQLDQAITDQPTSQIEHSFLHEIPPSLDGVTPPPPPSGLNNSLVAYYLHINGKHYGPYPVQQLREWINCGQVAVSTLAWREGMAQWQALNTLPEFAVSPPIPGMVPPPPPNT
jgi:hypothetical protein